MRTCIYFLILSFFVAKLDILVLSPNLSAYSIAKLL